MASLSVEEGGEKRYSVVTGDEVSVGSNSSSVEASSVDRALSVVRTVVVVVVVTEGARVVDEEDDDDDDELSITVEDGHDTTGLSLSVTTMRNRHVAVLLKESRAVQVFET